MIFRRAQRVTIGREPDPAFPLASTYLARSPSLRQVVGCRRRRIRRRKPVRTGCRSDAKGDILSGY